MFELNQRDPCVNNEMYECMEINAIMYFGLKTTDLLRF